MNIELIELIRLACYALMIIALLVLSGYFFREFFAKRLRASLAWAIGFFLFAIAIINLAFLAVEVSKIAIYTGAWFTAAMISLLYYGTSLLFFREGSFFREKTAIVIFAAVLIVETTLAYLAPEETIAEFVRGGTLAIVATIYVVIAYLFFRVSRRLSKDDPRRKTLTLVSISWVIIFIWNGYLALFWGEYPAFEAFIFVLASFGFLLLLYGMTTGKTTKK